MTVFHCKLVRMCMCTRVCKCVFLRICAPLLSVQFSSILCCCRVIFYTRQKKAVEGGNELFSLPPSRIPPSASLLYLVPSLPSTSILSALSPPLFCSLSPSLYVQGTICDCEIRPCGVTFRTALFKANCRLIICLPGFAVVCLYFGKKSFSFCFFGSPFSGDLGLPSRGWGKSLQWHRCPRRKCAEALAPGARAQWAASYSLLSSLIQLPTY